jgi:predicted lipase
MSLDKEMALFCLSLSTAAYTRDYANLPCTDIQPFADVDTDTEGFTGMAAGNALVIAFTGSNSEADWVNNLRYLRVPYPEVTQNEAINVHYGFYTAYLSVRTLMHETVESKQPDKVIVTGHSLGGGLATLCVLDIQYNFFPENPDHPEQVVAYTFGSPKVGNQAFVDSYNRRVPGTFRIVNGGDGVPWLPRSWQGYEHVDTLYRIDGSVLRIAFAAKQDHFVPAYHQSLRAL